MSNQKQLDKFATSLPLEMQERILDHFSDPYDAIEYCMASPKTPACLGTNSYLWEAIYKKLTDFPLPQNKTYRQGCMFLREMRQNGVSYPPLPYEQMKEIRREMTRRGEFPDGVQIMYNDLVEYLKFYKNDRVLRECLELAQCYMDYVNFRLHWFQIRRQIAQANDEQAPAINTLAKRWPKVTTMPRFVLS